MSKIKNGFTLVEILVVVAIIAVVSLLIVPPINQWVSEKKVRESSNKLIQIMRYAREQSVSSGLVYKIIYQNESSGITAQTFVEKIPTGLLTCPSGDLMEVDPKQNKKINFPTGSNTKISKCSSADVCTDNSLGELCFFSTGGATYSEMQIKDNSSKESNIRKIKVYASTGFIEIFRRKNNVWVSN
jgi:prepilin-type N-terminal cleavage/methylation domain-containing protein